MLQVTLITAASLALVNIWLAMRVAQVRVREKVALGDAGNPSLLARMRAHANFNEYVPLIVILMGLIEMTGTGRTQLIIAGTAITLGRIAHALGMDRAGENALRKVGILLTFLITIALAIWALVIAYA